MNTKRIDVKNVKKKTTQKCLPEVRKYGKGTGERALTRERGIVTGATFHVLKQNTVNVVDSKNQVFQNSQ